MKRVRVIYEGAADEACDALNGRSPLEAAHPAEASALARQGRGGFFEFAVQKRTYRPAERLALLLGVDAAAAAELEAGPVAVLAEDLDAASFGWAFRGNLVTLDGNEMVSPRLQNLTVEETDVLLEALKDLWREKGFTFERIGPGRFLALHAEAPEGFQTGLPPFLAFREPWTARQPLGRRKSDWVDLIHESHRLLAQHPVNEIRLDLSEDPANGIWLWGGGRPNRIWEHRPERRGIMLSQSPAALGLARWLGMESVVMEDPWSAMEGKQPGFRIARVVELLREHDDLVVFVGSPQEWGRYGSGPDKARAMKMLDRFVLSPLVSLLEAYRPYRILLTADGIMSSEQDAPLEGSVPFVLAGDGVDPDDCMQWDERSCADGALGRCRPESVTKLLERKL